MREENWGDLLCGYHNSPGDRLGCRGTQRKRKYARSMLNTFCKGPSDWVWGEEGKELDSLQHISEEAAIRTRWCGMVSEQTQTGKVDGQPTASP